MCEKRENIGIDIPYLICLLHVELHYATVRWATLSMEQMPHTLLRVVAHLPCRSITPVGSTMLMCGSGPAHGERDIARLRWQGSRST
jgi:hypothetical protein